MPFTISHAAAALPVHALDKRLPLAALMVGTMAPDFAFFLPWGIYRHDTHTPAGLFTFCLPAGLMAWLYYVLVLERPTIGFLPDVWRKRIRHSGALDTRALFMASLALLLGSVTHLAWDAFTHSAPLAQAVPALRSNLFKGSGAYLPVYFVLQVLSSLFGLVALAIWAWRIRRKPLAPAAEVVPELAPHVSNDELYLAVLLISVVSVAVGFFGAEWRGSLFHMLVGMMWGVAVGWSVLAVAVRFRSRTIRIFAQPDAD
jgi:hypothetical protein